MLKVKESIFFALEHVLKSCVLYDEIESEERVRKDEGKHSLVADLVLESLIGHHDCCVSWCLYINLAVHGHKLIIYIALEVDDAALLCKVVEVTVAL